MKKILVSNLSAGDVITHPKSGIDVVVISHGDQKVFVSKTTAQAGHGVMSIDYHSPQFDDCLNRVSLTVPELGTE